MKRFFEITETLKNNEKIGPVLREHGEQLKKIVILSLMIIIGLVVYNIGLDNDEHAFEENENQKDTVEQASDSIFVDIGGAVNNPMLAELPEGSRVEDAIQAAGGLTEDADISSINRAEFLEDGTKIYIPAFARDEEGNIVNGSSASSLDSGLATSSNGKVNINTADSDTLQTLTGVGPVTAEKIIDYRESSGRFSSIDDLKNVSGIGDKTFEKLKDYITI